MASFNRKIVTGLQPGTLYVLSQACAWKFLPSPRYDLPRNSRYGWPNGSSTFLYLGPYRDSAEELNWLKGISGDRMVCVGAKTSGNLTSLFDLVEVDRKWHMDFERYLSTLTLEHQPVSYYEWKINNVIR